MKKTIKKLTAMLCAALLLSSLAACGKTEGAENRDFSLSTLSPVDPNAVPEGAKEISAVKPGTYTILCHTPSNGLLTTSGEPVDAVDETIYKRNSELKEKYSIELKEMNITGKTVDFVRNSTLSGLVNYDIASLTYSDAILLTISNSLCPLSELGGYYQNRRMFSETLSVGGKQYVEDFNVLAPSVDDTYVLALNRSRLKTSKLEDQAWQMVKQGEWTYEAVHNFMRGNGTLGFSDGEITPLWVGGGVSFYENGMGDRPTYKKSGTKVKDIYSVLKNLNDEGYLERTSAIDGEDTFVKIVNKTLLTIGTVSQVESAIRGGLDLAVLPLPKLEKADKYSSFVSPDALCTVIPAGDEEKNSVAFALTGMLYEYDLNSARREDFVQLSGENGERMGEMLDVISSSRTLDLPALYGIGGLYDFLDESLRYNMLADAFMEGIDKRVQTAVVAIEIMTENGR